MHEYEIPINNSTSNKGKVNKTRLLVEIIRRESKPNLPVDMKRVLLIANKLVDSLPVGQRVGFTKNDFSKALSQFRSGHTYEQTPASTPNLPRIRGTITKTKEALLAARSLLRLADFNLAIAKDCLEVVYTLTKE